MCLRRYKSEVRFAATPLRWNLVKVLVAERMPLKGLDLPEECPCRRERDFEIAMPLTRVRAANFGTGGVREGRGPGLEGQNFGSYLGRTLRIRCLRLRMAAVSRRREKAKTAAQRAAVLVKWVPPVGFEPTPPPPEDCGSGRPRLSMPSVPPLASSVPSRICIDHLWFVDKMVDRNDLPETPGEPVGGLHGGYLRPAVA